MNVRTDIAALVLAAVISPAAAQEPTQSLPTVTAEVVHYVADCDHRVLPTQRKVGEWTGQHNFAQVYDTRQRLMAEIGRACQEPSVGQVRLVTRNEPTPRELDLVAVNRHRGN